MKSIILLLILTASVQLNAQNSDCYIKLHKRGVEEFDKNNYSSAILKWQSARDNCSDITVKEKDILEKLIKKANEKIKSTPPKVVKEKQYKTDTIYLEKIVIKKVYVDKPIEKIIYIDKPIEKIVYVDKPEPYHRYGKDKGKLVIYKSCSDCYKMKVSVDGVYKGTLTSFYKDGLNDCNSSGAINLITDAGSHYIECESSNGSKWSKYLIIKEDDCFIQGFK